MNLFDSLKAKIDGKDIRIVFPEATDERILGAAVRLQAEGLLTPILIGNPQEVKKIADDCGLHSSQLTIIDPENYEKYDEMLEIFLERRKGKVDEAKARELLKDNNYFGTMLTYMHECDGMVSGAIHSTGDTVRPALQIIKTKPGISRTSGAFVMMRGSDAQERYIFSDCAINVNPNAQELAEIALESARTAELFDIDPKVAMMSFSTKGSAHSPEVEKVVEATRIVNELNTNEDYKFDGELQFDAAYESEVAKLKAPDSIVAGNAKVFVFPDLQSGNIGYKIAQRLGNFEAIGPILQGLNQPVSDLSRGCVEEDVYKLSIITAAQSLMD